MTNSIDRNDGLASRAVQFTHLAGWRTLNNPKPLGNYSLLTTSAQRKVSSPENAVRLASRQKVQGPNKLNTLQLESRHVSRTSDQESKRRVWTLQAMVRMQVPNTHGIPLRPDLRQLKIKTRHFDLRYILSLKGDLSNDLRNNKNTLSLHIIST
jgi:hypothetical protein